MNCAIEAGVDLSLPIFRRCFDEAFSQRKPGIVDENVETSEILHHRLDHRLDRGEIGDVGRVGPGLAALARDLRD